MIIGFDASRAFVKERTGTENYSYQLLKALGEIDRENLYILYTRGKVDDNIRGEFDRFPNFKFKEINWPRLWTQGGLALATWRDKLDLLFVPAHTLPFLRKPGLKTAVTIHGLEYEYLPQYYRFPQRIYLTWSTRYALHAADKLIVVSKFTADQLVSRLGAKRNKISVIHEGVDALVYSKLYNDILKHSTLERLGITKPYILFVGVIQPRKNLTRLIEAFSKSLTGTVPVSLVIAGKSGWMYDEILKAPLKYGVEDEVKFIGYVSDEELPILFQEAEIYLQPSLTEGFGLPVLEAMAAGTPVIAANAGALPEILNKAGRLINPTSVDEIASAIREVFLNNELKKKLRKSGLERVKQFRWTESAKKTLAIFKDLVKNTI